MSERIQNFDPDQLSEPARAVYERILRSRGYVPGPYRFWLASPGFADRIEAVERFLRYDVSLDPCQVEIITLIVARHFRAQYVWSAHEPAALKAGVAADVVAAIREHRPAHFERPQDRICGELAWALLRTHEVDDHTWTRARDILGERGVNELIGLLGLYSSVCMTMIAYRMPAKGDDPEPLPQTRPG